MNLILIFKTIIRIIFYRLKNIILLLSLYYIKFLHLCLNIQYIGTWTSGAEMHLEFTSIPEHFVFNDKLIIYQYVPTIYVYFPDEDVWETKFSKYPKLEFNPADTPILMLTTMPCYIGKYCNLFIKVRFL